MTADGAPLALVLARWLHFTAVFVLFGTSFFWLMLGEEGWPRRFRASTLLLRLAALVAALSGVAWLAAMLSTMTGGVLDRDTLSVFFLQTPFGPFAALRLGLLAAALLALPMRNRALCVGMAVIGALLLVDQAWLGHAAEGGAGLWGGLMIFAYGVHVLAAAAWVGGLPPLLLVLFEQEPPDARKRTLEILSRYSAMAMVAVSLIVVSGLANVNFRLGGAFGRLFDSDYGAILGVKAGFVGAMLLLAGFNRFVVMPGLRAAQLESPASLCRLRASVAIELALSVLVLAVTALLGVTPPPA